LIELTEITDEMIKVNQRLDKAMVELHRLARVKSQSEHDYRVAIAKDILKLKAEGTPATIIPDLSKGNCAAELLNRDLNESLFTSTRESISILQTQASLLQSILRVQEHI
jgi:hypothetical protein